MTYSSGLQGGPSNLEMRSRSMRKAGCTDKPDGLTPHVKLRYQALSKRSSERVVDLVLHLHLVGEHPLALTLPWLVPEVVPARGWRSL